MTPHRRIPRDKFPVVREGQRKDSLLEIRNRIRLGVTTKTTNREGRTLVPFRINVKKIVSTDYTD
jgi:hypothetical protein